MKVGMDVKSLKLNSIPVLLAGLLALAGLWTLWGGWQRFAATRLQARTEATRHELVGKLQPLLSGLLQKAGSLQGRVALINAATSGDLPGARKVANEMVPGTETLELYPLDLSATYDAPEKFGFGKLALLERALLEPKPVLAVVKDAGGPRIGIAFVVVQGGVPARLVYLRQPVAPVVALVKDAAPGGAYVALRQGGFNVIESGNAAELKFHAETGAEPVPGSSLRVASAAPPVEPGLFGARGLGEMGLALVYFALAGGLWRWNNRRSGAAQDAGPVAAVPSEMTLAELHAGGHIVSPDESKAVRSTSEQAASPGITLDRSIFRAYDIRGVVGTTLDANIARLIGQAIGSVMQEKGQRSIVVGRDGRLSSPAMAAALVEGLRKAGREVIDIGEVPTPMAYFGSFQLRTGCCVSVTGSHNPPDYNGFKVVVDGETLSGDAIHNLYVRIAENRLFRADAPGLLSLRDIKADYISRISGDIQIERKLKVVIDCGSGVAGGIAPELLAAIGADVEPLYCDVDGTFPHHHPDPSDPANLQDLINVVQRVKADIGLALDGDGDRLGVVTPSGEIIYPDRLLMLFATDVLERNPGACVIYDVKCTGHLATHILRHGGSPLMWKTGHSLIKAKMRETDAELAGEMSGHFFFKERWYGFDDGIYAAARLLEILAAQPKTPTETLNALPDGVSTAEIKVDAPDGDPHSFVERFRNAARFDGGRLSTIDGLRVDYDDGWGLVRASNTTPVLVLRFDADSRAALTRIQADFRAQLLALKPDLKLPF